MTVSQTGCIGMCRREPMADVCLPGQKVTYVHRSGQGVMHVAEHIVNGRRWQTVGYEADSQ